METIKCFYISESKFAAIFMRLSAFNFENLMADILITCVEEKNKIIIQNLTLEDKVCLYHNIWEKTIEHLYNKHLPNNKRNNISPGIEITPYTYLLSTLFEENKVDMTTLSQQDLDYVRRCLADSIELDLINGFKEKSEDEKVNVILMLMQFPPLMELYNFLEASYIYHANELKILYNSVNLVGLDALEIPEFKTNISLHLASSLFTQKDYMECGGIDFFIENETFTLIKQKLLLIKSNSNDMNIPKTTICPDCGKIHNEANIPKEVFQYHHMKHDLVINKIIGLYLYDKYKEYFWKKYATIFENMPHSINEIENMKCVVLVEGDTEEIALPALAIKYGKPLATKKIHVMNSKSKQKLVEDFKKLKDNFPKLKICMLLDSDAVREKNEIQKLIEKKKDKFSLKYINKGTFEDLIPINLSIKAVNSIYPMENPIAIEHIDLNKDFVRLNINPCKCK